MPPLQKSNSLLKGLFYHSILDQRPLPMFPTAGKSYHLPFDLPNYYLPARMRRKISIIASSTQISKNIINSKLNHTRITSVHAKLSQQRPFKKMHRDEDFSLFSHFSRRMKTVTNPLRLTSYNIKQST